MYAALGSGTRGQYCNRKSKNLENITFVPKMFIRVTKNPRTLSESKGKIQMSEGKRQSQDVLLKYTKKQYYLLTSIKLSTRRVHATENSLKINTQKRNTKRKNSIRNVHFDN